MRTFAPDVVNVHFPDGQIPFVLRLRRRFKFRLVVSLHGHDVQRFTEAQDGKGTKRMPDSSGLRAVLREADAVTACSCYLLEKAARLEPSVAAKGTAIYNGVDLDRFRDRTLHFHPRPYILALGRLTYNKGFDLLLGAFAQVGTHFGQVDLILAGEGEDRAALEASARKLGVEGRVYFFGKAAPAEVIRLLNGCLFTVVPSRAETFGIVVLEALAAGKPVLATRVGGLPETVSLHRGMADASAVLVEPNVEELTRGLREMLKREMPPRCREEERAGAEEWLRELSWEKVAQRYEKVLAGTATLTGPNG
jgi:glycosyltransferase involved in cell wall biosynthesis